MKPVERMAHQIWCMADHDEREAETRATGKPMRPCGAWSPEQRRRHMRQAAYVLQNLQEPSPEMRHAGVGALGEDGETAPEDVWAAMIAVPYEDAWAIADGMVLEPYRPANQKVPHEH